MRCDRRFGLLYHLAAEGCGDVLLIEKSEFGRALQLELRYTP